MGQGETNITIEYRKKERVGNRHIIIMIMIIRQ